MPSRRQLLGALGAAGLAGFAGCSDDQSTPTTETGTDDDNAMNGGTADNTTASDAVGDESGDWPMPAFDGGATGYDPDHVGPRAGVRERWSEEIEWPVGRPIVADGRVYVPTTESLYAFAVDNGVTEWVADSSGGWWTTAPAFDDGRLYVGVTGENRVLALDAESGDELWDVETTGSVGAAPVPSHGGRWVFAGDTDGGVYRIDAETGEVDWEAETFTGVTTLVDVGTVYAGTEGGEVYALSESDGEGLWRQKLPGSIRAVAADGGGVYASTFGGTVHGLAGNARAGAIEWTDSEGVVAHGALVLTGDAVFGADGGGLEAIDRKTGERRWRVKGEFRSAPAAAGDTLYVGSDAGEVLAFALDGGLGVDDVRVRAKRWSHPVDGPVRNGFAVADGAVFALTVGGDGTKPTAYALETA
ncbi:outer membrane protein assembly factor BamB family protein [Halegenticoccus tardaugens]|uniref:outer membrane protein assembly factor BamB family protein n=1 Tax=Halegenticoccus tardaugens TaxID=2071624 RepID=UPI00100BC2AE|nr:PQQ-binding-like beta-propeller repeat protein [Halegenticoccus tardaugens]